MTESQLDVPNTPLAAAGSYGLPDFNKIQPIDILQALSEAGDRLLAKVGTLRDQATAPTFANTIEPLEFAYEDFERIANIHGALKISAPNCRAFEALSTEVEDLSSVVFDRINQDERLFERVTSIFEGRNRLGLDADQFRLVEATHERFVRHGVHLPPEKRVARAAHEIELHRLTAAFAHNLLEDRRSENDTLLPEIIYERQQLAKISTAKSHADLMARDSLPGSRTAIVDLLHELKDGFTKAHAEAVAWPSPAVKLSDIRFDFEEVHRRFEAFLGRTLGVGFRYLPADVPRPHPEMLAQEIYNLATGAPLGLELVDLFQRPEKCTDSCCVHGIQFRSCEGGRETLPVALRNYNFAPLAEGGVAPMTFRQVQLYLHERGHALNILLARSHYPSLSGWPATSASEMFALVMENLASKPEILSGLARDKDGHTIDDKTVQAAIAYDRYADDSTVFSAYSKALFDANFSLLDIEAYMLDLARPLPSAGDIYRTIAARTGLSEDFVALQSRSSRHIFGDYGYAGTYSAYPNADCAAKTLIESCSENGGLFNRPGGVKTLQKFFETSAAGTDVAASYRRIVGVSPDPHAVFNDFGTPQVMQPVAARISI